MFPPRAELRPAYEAKSPQHPGGRIGDTPGVGAAPVALAGNTVAGEARFIETPSMQAELFGLGTMEFGSRPVPPTSIRSTEMVPGARLVGTCGIDSGSDAADVTWPPGTELHATVGPVPIDAAAGMVPVELPLSPMTGNVGAALPGVDKPGFVAICGSGIGDGDGGAQTTTVPGDVGSEASGTGASVVSGAFGSVVAEKGPGLFNGEITIAPGTVGRPIAVLPVMATCALLGEPASSNEVSNVAKMVLTIPSP